MTRKSSSFISNPHVQGLLGMLLGVLVLVLVLGLLRLRRNGQIVDPGEMQMRADSQCMVDALRRATAGGRSITYSELDRIQAGCGE